MQRLEQLPCRYFGSPRTIERDRGPHRQLRLGRASRRSTCQHKEPHRLPQAIAGVTQRHQSDARDRLPSAALDHTSDPVDVESSKETRSGFVPRALDGGLRFMREESWHLASAGNKLVPAGGALGLPAVTSANGDSLGLDVYRILRANCDNTRRLAALHQQDIAVVSGSLWARVGNPIDRRHIQVGDDSLPALPVHREAPCRRGSAGVASRCRCWLALAVFHCASLPVMTECKVCAG